LQLAIANGRVTLVAKDVPLRQILSEWARVGQTRIVNGEKVTSTPLTLQLVDVPERQALEVLLRSVSGYLAAPRALQVAGVSQYDRIMIMPGTPGPAATVAGAPGRAVPQPFNRTPPQPHATPVPVQNDESMAEDESAEDEEEAEDEGDDEAPSEDELDTEERMVPVQPMAPTGVARPGMPVVAPGSTPADPRQPTPSAARPGEVIAPPQQPPQFRSPMPRQPPQNPPE
jgi:hypothetical protein